MWISEIDLTNFKAYEKVQFSFPKPEPRKNLVLIGALNGHGKTSLLEAIYVSLYGKDALAFLKRAGIQVAEGGWANWLNQALYKGVSQQRGGVIQMKTSIQINTSSQQSLKIVRNFTFDRDLRFKEESSQLYEQNGSSASIRRVSSGQEQSTLEKLAVPLTLAPLFFFDAEKLADQMQRDQASVARTGLNLLCGFDLLSILQADLQDYSTAEMRAIQDRADQDVLERKRLTYEQCRNDLNLLKRQEEKDRKEVVELKEEQKMLWQEIKQMEGGDTKTMQEYEKTKQQAINRQKSINDSLEVALGNSLAQGLIPQDFFSSLEARLTAEKALINHEKGKAQASLRLPEFMKKLRSDERVLGELGKVIYNAILEDAITDAWNSLFPLPPDGCAKKLWHNYLNSDSHTTLCQQMATWGQGLPDLPKLLAELQEKEDEARKISIVLDRLENTNIDRLRENLNLLEQGLQEKQQCIGGLNHKIRQKETECRTLETEYEQRKQEMQDAEPRLIQAKRADKLEKCLKKIKIALLERLTTEVSESASKLFKRLVHDQQVDSIVFDGDGKMLVLDQQKQPITLGLSAGERQIQIQALFGALAEVADYGAPLVIDSPLARLDTIHRQSLFDYWMQLPQQVILLAQNAEITSDDFAQLQPHVNALYNIQAETFEHGYKRASLQQNHFFDYTLRP